MAISHRILVGLALLALVVGGLGITTPATGLSARWTTVYRNETTTVTGTFPSLTLTSGQGIFPSGVTFSGVYPTGTGTVSVVYPSGTVSVVYPTGSVTVVYPTGTVSVVPTAGVTTSKYKGTVGVAPARDVTTVLSTVLVIPTPVGNGTRGVVPIKNNEKLLAYLADPVKGKHFFTASSDATPTSASIEELYGDAHPDFFHFHRTTIGGHSLEAEIDSSEDTTGELAEPSRLPLWTPTRASDEIATSSSANCTTAHGHEATQEVNPYAEANMLAAPVPTLYTVPILDKDTLKKWAEEHFRHRLGPSVEKRAAEDEDAGTADAADDSSYTDEASSSASANCTTAHGHKATDISPRAEAEIPPAPFPTDFTVSISDKDTLKKWAEQSFRHRLGPSIEKRTIETDDEEVIQAVGGPLENTNVYERKPMRIVNEADVVKNLVDKYHNYIEPAVCKTVVQVYEVSAGVSKLISTVAPQATVIVKRVEDLANFGMGPPTTLRRIKAPEANGIYMD